MKLNFLLVGILLVTSKIKGQEVKIDRAGVCQDHTSDISPLEAWMCQFVDWIRSSEEWKKLLKSKCDIVEFDPRWEEPFNCPNSAHVDDCVRFDDRVCEVDISGCWFCYCRKGNYKDWSALMRMCENGQENFKERKELFKKEMEKCERSNQDPSTSTAAYNSTAMEPPVHPTPTEGSTDEGPQTPEPPFDYCTSACDDVISGKVPNQPVGFATSGTITTIHTRWKRGLDVYCDCSNGPEEAWLVFQRRMDGSIPFYRGRHKYAHGFGNLSREFWLGLDHISRLTSEEFGKYELRIDLKSWKNETAYAEYSEFQVEGPNSNYVLWITEYSGNASDSLLAHNGREFSTFDRDYDSLNYDYHYLDGEVAVGSLNCAKIYQGAWWFRKCLRSHLNGIYYKPGASDDYHGIIWMDWLGRKYSLMASEMKFRRKRGT